MIDDDIKFFRQNFSASSLSDFHDTPKKNPLYQNKNNRLNVPHLKKYTHDSYSHHQREEDRHTLKAEIPLAQTKNISSRAQQFKMLNRLKSQYKQIKHLHPHLNSQQPSMGIEQSDKGSQANRPRFKQSKSKKKEYEEQKGVKGSHAQSLSQDRQQRDEPTIRQNPVADKTREIQIKISQNEKKLIKRLKSQEQETVQQYKSQIQHLKAEIDKLVGENMNLKKDVISKQLENNELKAELRRKQLDQKSVLLERQLQFSKNREKEYLETIKNLQDKDGSVHTLPVLEMTAEINYLKKVLNQNNQSWQQKLQEALQKQKKLSMQAIQKILADQISPTPMSEAVFNQQPGFGEYASQQAHQFVQPPPPPNYYPNINIRSPEYQRGRGQRVLEQLVEQIQHLRRPPNPVEDQLRTIKQSIKALMRRSQNGRSYKDLAATTDSYHMVNELQNLKMYIMKEENTRKNYSEQVIFYKNQNVSLIEENKQFRTQSTALQQSLYKISIQLEEANLTIQEQRIKIDEKSRSIEDLANSLANIQSHQIESYTKVKTNVDKQRSHQLETEIGRLKNLYQTQVIQLNKANEDKNKGLQHQINNMSRRIKEQQQQVITTTQKLRDSQIEFRTLSDKSSKDIAILRQANQRLQQEELSQKTQLMSIMSTNQQLQTQVKQRSHVVEHLWLVKEAEYENVKRQITRLKQFM